MLDAILSLKRESGFTFEDVDRVEVDGVPYHAPILLYPEPKRGMNGKFSIHYNAALAILDGHIDIDSYSDERARSPEVKEALSKVRINLLPLWDSARDEVRSSANPVRIFLKDGRVLTRTVSRWEMKGTRSNPLTREELEAKFMANASRVFSLDQSRRAAAIWYNLGEVQDINEAISTVA
jgi:2-methylcitrate dehydratase PrpD